MPYRLTIEIRNQGAMEQFQREFDDVLDAKRYAHNHVRGDIHWTVREDHMDGLAPEYAVRIEGTGEHAGKPLNFDGNTEAKSSDSLFTTDGRVDDD